MSIEQLKKEIEALNAEEQAELRVFLLHLRNARDPEYKRLLARRLDDKDPSHWLTSDKVEKRLDQR